jgi:hypothetical protein
MNTKRQKGIATQARRICLPPGDLKLGIIKDLPPFHVKQVYFAYNNLAS